MDDDGFAIVDADQRLKIISDARRQESVSYNNKLAGFEAQGSPDLTFQYGPTGNDPDASPKYGVMSGRIAPSLQTYNPGQSRLKPGW